ncbi:MAG: hypothetical protein ACOVQM_01390 [Pirellula sp.]
MFQFKSKRNALRNWVAIAISLCLSQFAVCQEPTEDVPSARPPQLPSEFSENLKDVLQDVQEIVKDAQDAIEGSGKEEVVGAEIDASMSLESISESPTKPADATDAAVSDLESQDPSSIKILNENTPDWVKEGLVLGEDHRLAVSSSLFPDREQCIGDLKSRLMNEVRSYLDKHVLELTSASQLPELTEEYVEANWLVADREFDNVQDRPSGTYHQLWKELRISSDQLEVVRGWEKSRVREKRTKQIGVLGGLGITAITVFSGLIGVLARREKAKLKK